MSITERRLRLLSWNLWELRGDLAALVEAIQDLDPDVLLLQEAPRLVLPTARLGWLAAQVGRRVLVHGRGLAILATDEVRAQVIRRGLRSVPQQLVDLNSTYPRGIAAARLAIPGGGAVVVASSHLALQESNRLRHAEALAALVRGAGAPVIVGGDFNEVADGPARRLLAQVLADPASAEEHTFPAAAPRRRIDAVLVTDEVRVHAAHTVRSTARVAEGRLAGASDHLPTLADISL